MLSRTDAVQGVNWAQDETDLIVFAADEKRVGKAVILTGSSMRSLHIKGNTDAAAAAVAPNGAWLVMTVTAAATADAA